MLLIRIMALTIFLTAAVVDVQAGDQPTQSLFHKWFVDFYAQLPDDVRDAYFDSNWKVVLSRAKLAADRGNPYAQTVMGLLCYHGNGVTQDLVEAGRWYELAAGQGMGIAQANLGDMYYRGEGVVQNYETALAYWTSAAEKGHTIAMTNLGIFYVDGFAIPPDRCKAYDWWRKAAALGSGLSQNNISIMFELGDGLPKDSVQAFIWAVMATKYMEPGQHQQAGYASRRLDMLVEKLTKEQLADANSQMQANALERMVTSLPSCSP